MIIILGSSSPRRKQLLQNIVNHFEIISPDIDESVNINELPLEYAQRISYDKLKSITALDNSENEIITITSDTIVTIDNLILGKPDGFNDAVRTLARLSNRKHEVITSISINYRDVNNNIEITQTQYEKSSVYFKNLNITEIEKYLIKTKYDDKAGSYAIQENGDMIIEKISGSMTNIIGFPLRLFYSMIVDMNIANKILNI